MFSFNHITNSVLSSKQFEEILKSQINSKELIGICSFTTQRDNKPMRSLYGNKYRGYCIEYEIPGNKDIVSILCPVIYTKQFDNNLVKTLIKFAIENLIRVASSGKIDSDIGCIAELSCTKDSDWKYQDECRLIGNAKNKVKGLKIKNIYLGFCVDKENEDKIRYYSKKLNFGVYKMNTPTGFKTISYKKIC